MKTVAAVAIGIVVLGFCMFLLWCGGFNFDKRNPDVAFGVGLSLIISVSVGILTKVCNNE